MTDADPHLSTIERTQALQWLAESHREFLASIEGVSRAQWAWTPAPGRWSVGETAEHIVLAEAVLFRFLQRAIAAAPNGAWHEHTSGKTALIVAAVPSRQGSAQAPDPIVPRQALTREQVKERFELQREAIVAFAAGTPLPLKAHTMEHPFPAFGTLNGYQWLILIPLHTMRHVKQIAEVKSTPGYPRDSRRLS